MSFDGNGALNYSTERHQGDVESLQELILSARKKRIEKVFTRKNPLMSIVSKGSFEGSSMEYRLYSASGATATAGHVVCRVSGKKISKLDIKSKAQYIYTAIDGETYTILKHQKGSEEVLTTLEAEVFMPTEEAMADNIERQITINDAQGEGSLGEIEAVSGSGTAVDPFVVELKDGANPFIFQIGQLVSLGEDGTPDSGAPDEKGLLALKIENIEDRNANNKVELTLVGTPATAPAADVKLYRPSSKDNEFAGLLGILRLGHIVDADPVVQAAKNTVHGIDFSKNKDLRGVYCDAAGADFSTSLLTRTIRKVEQKGSMVDTILVSEDVYTEMETSYDNAASVVQVPYSSGNSGAEVVYGVKAVKVVHGGRELKIVTSRFLPEGTMLGFDSSKAKLYFRRDGAPKWDLGEHSTQPLRSYSCNDYLDTKMSAYGAFWMLPKHGFLIENLNSKSLYEAC